MTTNLSANVPTDTPIPTGGETTASPITVTILDAATIFEGPETVYRYDLPGTGIVEGWALGQVMDQISKMAGSSWPDVEACVVADSSGTGIAQEATTIICRQLEVTGVRLFDSEPAISSPVAPDPLAPRSHPVSEASESAPPTAVMEMPAYDEPVTSRWTDRLRGWLAAIDIFHVAIAVVIIAVAGASCGLSVPRLPAMATPLRIQCARNRAPPRQAARTQRSPRRPRHNRECQVRQIPAVTN